MIDTQVFQLENQSIDSLISLKKRFENMGYKYGWKANQNKPYDQGHWNRQILKNSQKFPYDHGQMPYIKKEIEVNSIWNNIQLIIGKRALFRVYLNGYTYGTDGYAHKDETWMKEKFGPDHNSETIIIYLNKDWHHDWAGETVLFNECNEIEASILPKFGRMLVFDSNKLHAARPLSRICPALREVLVFKTFENNYQSSMINWLFEKTKDIEHSGKTFFEHLFNTGLKLENMKQDEEVIKGGLFHAIYQTEYFFHDIQVDRDEVKHLIGERSENLAWLFSTMKNRYHSLLNNTENLDKITLESLLAIELANLEDQNRNGKQSDRIKELNLKMRLLNDQPDTII